MRRPGRPGSARGRTLLLPLILFLLFLPFTAAPVEAIAPHSTTIDLTPDGAECWVTNPDHGTVSVFAAAGPNENQLLAEIAVGRETWCLDIHPTNGEVWVTSERDDRIVILDGPSRTAIDTIDGLGFGTFGVAFQPSGDHALVTASGSDQIFVVETATRSVIATKAVYRRPRGIVWNHAGTRAWITHLLMPETYGRYTRINATGWTKSEVLVSQDFNIFTTGGYPSTVQTATFQPPPADSIVLFPNVYINTLNGELTGGLMTPTTVMHSVLRPLDVIRTSDLVNAAYKMSESGTPVSGPIALDHKNGKAYVANLSSNDVTVLAGNLHAFVEDTLLASGDGPVGIVTHPAIERAYVHNWLSRDVTVIDTSVDTVVATVAVTGAEVLEPNLLNGKKLFFTSRGNMSFENRNACAHCHVWGTHDGRTWDFSQFGGHLRATPDIRTVGFTGAQNWTATMDETHDHEFGILDFMGGTGLIPDSLRNDPLGPSNEGLSSDLDDLASWIHSLTIRPETPFQAPGGGLTPAAEQGRAIFNDPTVGCATCHAPPFFTDSRLDGNPFVLHDVGTFVAGDTAAAGGYDTPTLMGVWDTGPFFHDHSASTIRYMFEFLNPNDLHGATSALSTAQLDQLQAYVRSIGGPEGTPTGVAAGEDLRPRTTALRMEMPSPNPFARETSLRFFIDQGPADVTVDVYNVAGRRVRGLLDRTMTRGTHIVGWDGRDDGGRDVAAGAYFARLTVNGTSEPARKLIIIR